MIFATTGHLTDFWPACSLLTHVLLYNSLNIGELQDNF